MKKYILIRFHPRKIILDTVGVTWAAYFLWMNNWPAAVLSIVLCSGLGLFLVRHVEPHQMAQTTLGRLGLIHLHPLNFFIQILGLIPLIHGLWIHSAEYILVGTSLMLIGHIFGWSKVNENYRIN